MDPCVAYLITLGYTTKEIHGKKAYERVKMVARHFGVTERIPEFSKKHARKLLCEFLLQDRKNKTTFIRVFAAAIQKRFAAQKYSPSEHEIVICNLPAPKFYQSKEWRNLRYHTLRHHGNKCRACGRAPKDGVIIHVDHILPRSIYPEYALCAENVQPLCEDCNTAKSNKYEDDWR